jgi:hypothetical protein
MGPRLRRISIATAMYRNGKSSWPPNVKSLGLTAVKYAVVPEISQNACCLDTNVALSMVSVSYISCRVGSRKFLYYERKLNEK